MSTEAEASVPGPSSRRPPRPGRRRVLALGAAALAIVLLAFAFRSGGRTIEIGAIPAPPGTVRAVRFEYRARCHRDLLRLSAVAPSIACTSEMMGAGTIAPEADGSIRLDRRVELAPFVDDALRLLDERLADPALSEESRHSLEMHRLRLGDALRFWSDTDGR